MQWIFQNLILSKTALASSLQDYLLGLELKYKPYITSCLLVYNVLIYTSESSLVGLTLHRILRLPEGPGPAPEVCFVSAAYSQSWSSLFSPQQLRQLLLASRLLGLEECCCTALMGQA